MQIIQVPLGIQTSFRPPPTLGHSIGLLRQQHPLGVWQMPQFIQPLVTAAQFRMGTLATPIQTRVLPIAEPALNQWDFEFPTIEPELFEAALEDSTAPVLPPVSERAIAALESPSLAPALDSAPDPALDSALNPALPSLAIHDSAMAAIPETASSLTNRSQPKVRLRQPTDSQTRRSTAKPSTLKSKRTSTQTASQPKSPPPHQSNHLSVDGPDGTAADPAIPPFARKFSERQPDALEQSVVELPPQIDDRVNLFHESAHLSEVLPIEQDTVLDRPADVNPAATSDLLSSASLAELDRLELSDRAVYEGAPLNPETNSRLSNAEMKYESITPRAFTFIKDESNQDALLNSAKLQNRPPRKQRSRKSSKWQKTAAETNSSTTRKASRQPSQKPLFASLETTAATTTADVMVEDEPVQLIVSPSPRTPEDRSLLPSVVSIPAESDALTLDEIAEERPSDLPHPSELNSAEFPNHSNSVIPASEMAEYPLPAASDAKRDREMAVHSVQAIASDGLPEPEPIPLKPSVLPSYDASEVYRATMTDPASVVPALIPDPSLSHVDDRESDGAISAQTPHTVRSTHPHSSDVKGETPTVEHPLVNAPQPVEFIPESPARIARDQTKRAAEDADALMMNDRAFDQTREWAPLDPPEAEQPASGFQAISPPLIQLNQPRIEITPGPLRPTLDQPSDPPFPSAHEPLQEFFPPGLPVQGFSVGGPVKSVNLPSATPIAPSDTVPALLTPGEFIINARDAQKNLPILRHLNQGGEMAPDLMTNLNTASVSQEESVADPFAAENPLKISRKRAVQRQRTSSPEAMVASPLVEPPELSVWRSLQSGTFDPPAAESVSSYSSPPRIFRAPVSTPASGTAPPAITQAVTQWSSVEELLGIDQDEARSSGVGMAVANTGLMRTVIQRQEDATEGGEMAAPAADERAPMTETIVRSDAAQTDNESAAALETLAQEIYQRLRQRLEIERERQGFYAGRLPW